MLCQPDRLVSGFSADGTKVPMGAEARLLDAWFAE